MPAVVAAVSAFASTAVGGFIVKGLGGAIISFGLSKIASLISKPKSPLAGEFARSAQARMQMVRSAIETHKVLYGKVRVSGPLVLATTTDYSSTKNRILHLIVPLAGHEIESVETVYLNDSPLTLDGSGDATNSAFVINGLKTVRVKAHLGTATQAAESTLTAATGIWTTTHQLKGIAYLYVRLIYDRKSFPNGIPNVSAIVKGKKLYDPRSGTTAWSDNWALCMYDYVSNTQYGLGATTSEIDTNSFTAAANIADETVALAGGGTQKRYTCNGVVDTGAKPVDVLKDLVTAGAGIITYSQGKYWCAAGAYTTPTVTIDDSWLAGALQVKAKTERGELFNAVKGTYVEPGKKWQPTDFPMVTNATYETQDGGFQVFQDLELPFTTDATMAQRIAKIALEKSRQGITITMPCNLKALQLTVWDTVMVTNTYLGWSSKVFRVLGWEFSGLEGIILTLQEESSSSYNWNSGEASTNDAAPDTELPSPNFVYPASVPIVTEELYSSLGGGTKARAVLNWTSSTDAFVARYIVEYKLTSSSTWLPASEVSGTTALVNDLAPGNYDFRVIAVNWQGVTADAASTTKEFLGLTASPSDLTGFTLNAVHNQAHLQWDQVQDLDVKNGGFIEVRWTSKTSGATWSDGVQMGPALPGIATNATVPLRGGTYMAKAVDSSGVYSTNTASIDASVVNLVNMNVVVTSPQHTGFSGTKTNMTVVSSELKLDSGQTSGSYQFSHSGNNYIDLGAVMSARVSIDVQSLVYDPNNTFDAATGNFDSRSGLFDGGDVGDATILFYIRTTADNPAGSPTWSSWRQFVLGDYTFRACQIKMEVTTGGTAYSFKVSNLNANIDVPDREEKFLAQSIASGGSTLTYATPFYGKPNFATTISSTVSGDTVSYTHVTSGGKYTGVTVQVLNGAGVARTCDVYVKGY